MNYYSKNESEILKVFNTSPTEGLDQDKVTQLLRMIRELFSRSK